LTKSYRRKTQNNPRSEKEIVEPQKRRDNSGNDI